jgi:hypothetical protein
MIVLTCGSLCSALEETAMSMRQMISPGRLLPLLFIFPLSLLTLSCTKSPSPEDIVGEFVDAFNEHDVTRQMEMFSDSIVFDIPRMSVHFVGKEAQLPIAEYDTALHAEMTLTNVKTETDTLFCSITETNDWLEAADIPSAYYPDSYFVVDNDKISYIHADPADSTVDRISEVLSSFVPWAYQNHPEEMSQLLSHGRFVYGGANGTLVVSLLREWNKEQDGEE